MPTRVAAFNLWASSAGIHRKTNYNLVGKLCRTCIFSLEPRVARSVEPGDPNFPETANFSTLSIQHDRGGDGEFAWHLQLRAPLESCHRTYQLHKFPLVANANAIGCLGFWFFPWSWSCPQNAWKMVTASAHIHCFWKFSVRVGYEFRLNLNQTISRWKSKLIN